MSETLEGIIKQLKSLHDARETTWQSRKDRLDASKNVNKTLSIILGQLIVDDWDYTFQVYLLADYASRLPRR